MLSVAPVIMYDCMKDVTLFYVMLWQTRHMCKCRRDF
jgi:hypothetical protein